MFLILYSLVVIPKVGWFLFFYVFYRATTIQYFDELTSSYISLGPTDNMEEPNSDELLTQSNDENNMTKMSNDKVKQVRIFE